ncbi:MAG: saccharopine dehydrogenase (NAD+, L-lysine-forming) [Patiriisocius sp.]|jgi:saccharopine dehydrogenase (NAD+, L-lysine-forming)
MSKVKIGVIREGKVPPDKRVPLTPEHCKRILEGHYNVEIVIQSSPIRAFSDDEYSALGLTVQEDVSDCDILMGVKEVPKSDLLPQKVYFFFSHTYKEQPYNAALLKKILDRKIQLVDYELIKDKRDRRLIGFGRYAGVVGSYNGFRGWGEKMGTFSLKPAHLCHDREEMEGQLSEIVLPKNFRMVMSGHGRVGNGAMEIIKKIGLKEVTPEDYLANDFDVPVFTHIDSDDYNDRADGSEFETSHFYAHPEMYVSEFFRFAKVSDMYIASHYWDAEAPQILTKDDLRNSDCRLKMIADISCDIEEPIASTLRATTIAEPFFGYDKASGQEVDFMTADSIGVMSVDNLPCELPRDASKDFGEVLLTSVLPALLGEDPDRIIERASETNLEGKLMPNFDYLMDYVNS